MIRIEAGRRQLWQGFELNIREPITFREDGIYRLHGPNGSGKSSFIQRILIPTIIDRRDFYIICVEQQLHLQLIALKAQAAIFKPGFKIDSESDLWRYLWDNLSEQPDEFPVCVIADEAHSVEIPQGLARPIYVIYSSHHYNLDNSQDIHFEPINIHESLVYV
jgi:hypothetical protein|nr:hypothetical protein [Candidatus Cloacimonadota bacterium]